MFLKIKSAQQFDRQNRIVVLNIVYMFSIAYSEWGKPSYESGVGPLYPKYFECNKGTEILSQCESYNITKQRYTSHVEIFCESGKCILIFLHTCQCIIFLRTKEQLSFLHTTSAP